MRLHRIAAALSCVAVLALAGCAPRSETIEQTAPSQDNGTNPGPVDFADRTWLVSASPSVAVGSTYLFKADGTLEMTGPGSTPAKGTWRRDGAGIVMVEEGIEYPTDILVLTRSEFKILSHNPGTPVEITMVPADAQ